MLRSKNLVLLVQLVLAFVSVSGFEIMSRNEWGARAPKSTKKLSHPVPYVVIHHSSTPACNTKEACTAALKSIQSYHMDTKGWDDIAYNFVSGGDGRIYTGRDWSAVGAHAPNYNSKSIGICFLGDWSTQVPPAGQLKIVQELIQNGVRLGYISPSYKLIGHKQVSATQCPGNGLFSEIKTWDNWTSNP